MIGWAAALVLQTAAPAMPAAPAMEGCLVSAAHVEAEGRLPRAVAAVSAGRLTILAMGSSSIEGVGASMPDRGFVPMLEAGLERRLPGVAVTVVNRGIGGETAMETADRLEREIAANDPDLVLWQLGTNDILRSRPMDDIFADFRRGEAILDAAEVDVLLIDPQRLPDDTDNPGFMGKNPPLKEMADLIGLEAGRVGYGVLRRFDAMGDWTGVSGGGVGPDDLHLNDAGYACWAEITAEGLAAALR